MDIFIKSAAGTLVALLLYLILGKQGKDMSLLLSLAVCCMLAAVALESFKPVVAFLERLKTIGKMDNAMFQTVLRAVGIGLLAEITSLLCADAGNTALGKSLQLLAAMVVLWLSLPIFTQLIDLVEDVLQLL